MRLNHTLETIEDRISALKEARLFNAREIQDLEERTMVINDELEKLLEKKGELIAQERMKEYFKDEQ